MLASQSLQQSPPNESAVVLSDGGDTVRDLQMRMSPQAEHVLDWFHVTERLQTPRLPCIVGHDHEILRQAVRVFDEVGQESFGTESQALKDPLSRLLADCYLSPDLIQLARPGYGEDFVCEAPAESPAPMSE